MHYFRKSVYRALDLILTPAVLLFAPLAVLLSRLRDRAPLSRSVCDRFEFAIVRHHYYEPIVFAKDLKRDLDLPREIAGLDLNEAAQLDLVGQFNYRDELLKIPTVQKGLGEFGYHNGSFEHGDAEFLYNMIRHFQPRRIIEVGSGNSTLMARLAIEANRTDNPRYECEQICIEPFEQPWLESAGVCF